MSAAPAPVRTWWRTREVGLLVDAGLAGFTVAALAMMWRYPGWATIPYHLIFVSVMLVYGFRIWSVRVTVIVVLLITLSTGWLMLGDYREGAIEWAELAEIPLMPALLVAMVWHARRRAAAHRALEEMTAVQAGMLDRERTFFRDTSHAIRTPVTIARGHLELAATTAVDLQTADDIDVAMRQLDRMSVLSNRLLALAQLESGETLPAQRLDLGEFVGEVGRNWSVDPTRVWTVSGAGGAFVEADPVWLALAVDALVENAVHFTTVGGRVQIRGEYDSSSCSIVVSDDGAGIHPADQPHVFERFWHRRPPDGPMGSGLGLAMARATARAWGGDVRAGRSPLGGARFELVLPRS
ncbi:sensor histidine kinase [Nocardioides sp. GCM10027113]|uniref:sensor histidine kinase n=1 Tax=unclassified Nocardioides TaxID=2615069 RepID=UPI00361964A8